MIHVIRSVLDAADLARCRARLSRAAWLDGGVTAGAQSALAKRNLQLDESAPEAGELGGLILDRLGRNPAFLTAALPARVFPPLFNRYDEGMGFGEHVDNAIRHSEGGRVRWRTDLSCTLFLSDPADYDGGELVIDEGRLGAPVKLEAGDLVLYPASTVHRVSPVTRGQRLASFFWVQSMVRDHARRELLWALDRSVADVRSALGDDHLSAVRLTGTYHNLIRMWAET